MTDLLNRSRVILYYNAAISGLTLFTQRQAADGSVVVKDNAAAV